MKILNGQCLCQSVQYSVSDEFSYAMNCHCSQCRRATGSAFKAFGGIEANKFRITAGESHILKFGNDVDFDARCAKCGSLLFSSVQDGQFVHVTYGTLTDNPSLKPKMHIYVGSKASWFEITDQLPQFKELPN